VAAVWAFALLPGVATGAPEQRLAAAPAAPVACIESWPEVQRRAHGYDHFVRLSSRCTTPARCEVSTDANPAPIRVIVEPEQQRRILLARGSPAPTFVPHVSCRFRPLAHPERQASPLF
jgi:hypothetical protein